MTLPIIALSLAAIAAVTQQVRGSVLDALSRDYVRTLRSRGLGMNRVVYKHVLRNAGGPALAILALQFIGLLGGAVIIEQVFALPGIGQLTVQATVVGRHPDRHGGRDRIRDHRRRRQPPHRHRAGRAQPEGETVMTTAITPAPDIPIPQAHASLLRRLVKRPLGAISLAFLVLVGLVAIFGPMLAPYDPNTASLQLVLAPPSPEHLLGGDSAGRDVFSRLLAATQVSVAAALLALVVALVIGVIAGLIAGYYRGMVRQRLRLAHVAGHVAAGLRGAARRSSGASGRRSGSR